MITIKAGFIVGKAVMIERIEVIITINYHTNVVL